MERKTVNPTTYKEYIALDDGLRRLLQFSEEIRWQLSALGYDPSNCNAVLAAMRKLSDSGGLDDARQAMGGSP